MQHLYVIDVLRALAALSVCLYHFESGLHQRGQSMGLLHEIAAHGHLGVAVFFVISGFVIPLSMRDWRLSRSSLSTFLSRRMLRLYPPYAIASLLALGLWQFTSLVPGFRGISPAYDPSLLVHSFTLTAALVDRPWILVVAWSLAIEVQFYLAIALVLPLLRSEKRFIAEISLVLWSLLPLALPWGALLTSYAALFGMGMSVYLFQAKRLSVPGLLAALAISGAVQIAAHDATSAVAGLATAAAMFLRPKVRSWWTFLGATSYSLYLVHVPIGGRVINLGARIPQFPGLNILLLATAMMASLVAAALFYRWVERPWVERSRNIRSRKTAETEPAPPPVLAEAGVEAQAPT